MLKSTSLFLCLFALSLGACSFKKSGADDKSAAPATVTQDDVNKQLKSEQETEVANAQIEESDIKIIFDDTEKPNVFTMTISWPEHVKHISIQTKNELVGSTYSPPLYFNYRNSSAVDVEGGKRLQILLTTFDAHNSPVATVAKSIDTPIDIIIDQAMHLRTDTVISGNRIYFTPNGSIDADGHNLSISANKILAPDQPIANGYQIVSLRPELTSANKKNGGTIVIYSKTAIGFMRVGLFGATGIDGKSGEEIDQIEKPQLIDPTQLNGANGTNGAISERSFHCKSLDGACPPIQFCSRQPTNGEDGRVGQKGTDGQAGSWGGDTGNLSTIISDSNDFHLFVVTKIGKGGRGGVGAPGHPGGKGGHAGQSDSHGICNPAHNGSDGAQGPKGQDGVDGIDGKVGTIECDSIKHCEKQNL